MKLVIQRTKEVTVQIDGDICSKKGKGMLILFGVEKNDTEDKIDYLANKVLNLRLFEDENAKMNLSILDTEGEIMVVSQFTLAANCSKGLRPSFDNAMKPDIAIKYYEKFVSKLKESKLVVKTGVFGADMKVALVNDGPVTFILEK